MADALVGLGRVAEAKTEDGRWFLNPENHSRHMYKIKRPDHKAAAYGSDPEAESGKAIGDIMAKRFEDPDEFEREVAEANAMRGGGPFRIGQVVPIQEAFKIAELSYPVASMHCICRYHCRGHEECNKDEYSCTGLGVGMFKWERWPERYTNRATVDAAQLADSQHQRSSVAIPPRSNESPMRL